MSTNTDDVVSAYLAIRTERERIRNEYEAQDAILKQEMAKLEENLLAVCNDINATSFRTSHGTVMRKLNERFYCTDWDNFYNFVSENNAVHLLEKRIHQGNFKEFLADNQSDGLPPGVNVLREYAVTVRKSN